MTANITFNYSAILTMGALAILVAAILPFPEGKTSLQQAGKGVLRALIGCAAAAAIWTGGQVAGKALEDRFNPSWTKPVVIQIPLREQKPPGHTI